MPNLVYSKIVVLKEMQNYKKLCKKDKTIPVTGHGGP
jgi:hypothetical protein